MPNVSKSLLLLGLIAVLVAGCSSGPVLEPRPAANTAGVDLSGNWMLRESEGGTRFAARETLVYVFVETGRTMRISQTESGLFVSFDRSVVEEYRFGEHRQISVGEISAERVSGWDGERYVIETLDKDDARLTDAYRLIEDGSALEREIVLTDGRDTPLRLVQTYDRQ